MGLVFALFLIMAIPAIAYYDLRQTSGAEPLIYRPVAPVASAVSTVDQSSPTNVVRMSTREQTDRAALEALTPPDPDRRLES